jgi:drug/metabolite transporter (DMT)-like permease
MSELTRARWALAAVCFFWGTTYYAIRVAVIDMPPALFCAVRFLIAGAALLAFELARGRRVPRGGELGHVVLVGLLLLGCGNGTLAWAEQWIPSGIASLIVVTTPFWMVAFARAGGERVRPRAAAGLGVGFIGLAILLWPDLRRRHPGPYALGSLALLGSSMLWAYGSILSKRRRARIGAMMTIAVQMLAAGVLLGAAGLLRGEAAHWRSSAQSWLAVAYLIVFGSIVGYGSYIYALERLPTPQVAIYGYVNPIIAVLLGVLLLGERFDLCMAVGIPMVLGGVYLVHTGAPAAREASAPVDAVPA